MEAAFFTLSYIKDTGAAVEVLTFSILTFGGGWAKLQNIEELTYGN
jgi:hypothetical protein